MGRDPLTELLVVLCEKEERPEDTHMYILSHVMTTLSCDPVR